VHLTPCGTTHPHRAETAEDCVHGLGAFTWKHVQENNLPPQGLTNLDVHTGYAANFGVGRLSFFRSAPYKKYIQAMHHSRGMFEHRWIEQSILPIVLALFAPTRVEMWPSLFETVLQHRSEALGRRMNTFNTSITRPWTPGCSYTPPQAASSPGLEKAVAPHKRLHLPASGSYFCKCRFDTPDGRFQELITM